MKRLPYQAMSQEQLAALIAKLQEDAGLREKLKGAVDLDAAVALAQDAGLDVSKEEWLKYQQGKETKELSDAELERVSGGTGLETTWGQSMKYGYEDCVPCGG
jgi:predicted ribosomally synthesized peptide with nif11-like leader